MRLAGRNWSGRILSTSPRCFLRCRRHFIRRWRSFTATEYVGFFPAAIAAGALVASLTSGWTKNIHRHGLMVTVAAVLWGVAIIFFGLANSIVPALLFLGAAGFFDMISGIFRGSIWNQTIPNYLRGRLASIEMMSYLTGPMLGSAKMGIVAEKFGVRRRSFPAAGCASSRLSEQQFFCRNSRPTTAAKASNKRKAKKPNAPK